MDYVADQTPWWHEVPRIWQIDAEQQGLPRPPSPDEIARAVDAVRARMARERRAGYVIVYAPRWLYGDSLGTGYDLWNSDYTGSGAPRPFTDQYRGVTDRSRGWAVMSGRRQKSRGGGPRNIQGLRASRRG